MPKPDLNFDQLSRDVQIICADLETLVSTFGPSRCVARMANDRDPRIGKNYEFPMFAAISTIVERMSKDFGLGLWLFQDCGNIILLSTLKSERNPTIENIKEIPVTLTSHADEITFLIKKDSKVLFPLCNTRPFSEYGFMHHEGKILGFRGEGDERVFREVGTAELHQKEKKPVDKKKSQEKKFEYFLQNIKGDEQREGDLVVPNYNLTQKNYGLKTIFHSKALDDRVGVLSDIYTVKELARAGIPSKAILVGDEEGVDSELAWARLARPSFARYCRPDGITILCDGFDGKKLYEFSEFDGKHLEAGLIAPYRSEGKGAGDPGLFSLLRDEVIPLAKKHGFEAVTTTDYVSRSLDPKIMDDFPFICSIDWSNGPVMTPTFVKDNPALSYFNVCHVDESVAISQVLNIIGTTFWSACFLHKKMVQP